jgi:hypothetical protein
MLLQFARLLGPRQLQPRDPAIVDSLQNVVRYKKRAQTRTRDKRRQTQAISKFIDAARTM